MRKLVCYLMVIPIVCYAEQNDLCVAETADAMGVRSSQFIDSLFREINENVQEISSRADIIESKACALVTDLDSLESKIDALIVQDCGSLIEILDSDVDSLVESSSIIQSKVCQIDSQLDSIESKIDILDATICKECDVKLTANQLPITISAPGVYCLEENINATQSLQSLIIINGSDIVLDLKGHTININGFAQQAIRVQGTGVALAMNVTVKNGSIRNLANTDDLNAGGILVASSTGIIIQDIAVFCNCLSNSGFIINNSTGVTIQNCEAVDYVGLSRAGFKIVGSTACTLTDCVARGGKSSSNGFHIITSSTAASSEHNCFINCKALTNDGNGFFVTDDATGGGSNNVFIGCIAHNNVQNGFEIVDTQFIFLLNCVANRNQENGILIGKPGTDPFTNNCVVRNSITAWNNLNGILLDETSLKNKVLSCIITGNQTKGVIDLGTNNAAFNNCSQGNGAGSVVDIIDDNYSNIDPVESVIDTTVKYWVNVSV